MTDVYPTVPTTAGSKRTDYPAGFVVPQYFGDDVARWNLGQIYGNKPLPPERYDRPPTEPFFVIDLDAHDDISRACGHPPTVCLVGCAFLAQRKIYIAHEIVLRQCGATRNLVLRHEIGHLNGWPGIHEEARFSPLSKAGETDVRP